MTTHLTTSAALQWPAGYRINARVLLNRGDVLTIGHTQFHLQ